jgi:hypothetical protein
MPRDILISMVANPQCLYIRDAGGQGYGRYKLADGTDPVKLPPAMRTIPGLKVTSSPVETNIKANSGAGNEKEEGIYGTTAKETGGRCGSITIPVEPEVERERIASLAYAFWLERGCPDESSQEDWFRAERHLASRSDENVDESKAA